MKPTIKAFFIVINLKAELSKLSEQIPIPHDQIAGLVANATMILDEGNYQTILNLVQMDGLFEEIYYSPALCSMPGWGERGIDQLLEIAFGDNQKIKVRSAAIEVVLAVCRGVVPKSTNVRWLDSSWDAAEKYSISKSLAEYSLIKLREKLLIAFEDEYQKSVMLGMLGSMAQFSSFEFGPDDDSLNYFLSLIIDNQLILNSTTIQNFEDLINGDPAREEELQVFLSKHPVLLDPFVNKLFTKQELGSDFITDYVVQRTNNQYVLVEIEKSTKNLFNQNGTFTSGLTQAIAQVRDFQAWISDNLAYAQKKLPEIKHPEGLVVIGRSGNFEDLHRKRLAEENFSRKGHIKIVTYDDLLETAKCVYRNIIERPAVITTKDTRSI